MDLFFVLSGFLIGGILLRNRDSANYYQVFYFRRVLRILPVFVISVVAVRLLAPDTLQFPLWSHLTLSQDYFFAYARATGLENTTTPLILGAVWSLAIEEKFYLAIAPTIRLLRTRIRPIALSAFAICPVIRYFECQVGGQVYALALPFGRFDSLLCGVLIADFVLRNSEDKVREVARTAMPAAALLASLIGFIWLLREFIGGEFLSRVFGHSFLAGMFGCVVLHVSTHPDRWNWLRSSVLVRMGTLSYAVYLLHEPVFYFFSLITSVYVIRLLGSCSVTYLLAAFSWWAMESRLIKVGQAYTYRQTPQPYEEQVATSSN